MFSFLALFAALPARAASPAAYCGTSGGSSCTLTVSANQEILVDAEEAANTAFSDTLGLTYTLAFCDKQTPASGGANSGYYACHYWARSGASSGSDVVSGSAGDSIWVQSYNGTDLDVTVLNPVDAHIFSQGLIGTTGGCSSTYCFDAGNITTSVAHDVIDLFYQMPNCSNFYAIYTSIDYGSVPLTPQGFGTSSTMQHGCAAFFNTVCATGCPGTPAYGLVDSGAAGTYDVFLNFSSVNFYFGIAVSVVTYKGVPHTPAGRVKHRVIMGWFLPFGFPFRRKIIVGQIQDAGATQ